MRSNRLVVVTVLTALGIAMLATPGSAERLEVARTGGAPLEAVMLPENEVPPAASDASGTATVTLNAGREEVCFELDMGGFGSPVVGGHIHLGEAGVNGPVVVSFTHPVNAIPPEEEFPTTGCVPADRDLVRDILRDPAGYYVNIHTVDLPAGEIRGQLGR